MTRAIITTFLLMSFFVSAAPDAAAACGDTWQSAGSDTFSGTCPYQAGGNYYTTKHWRIFWTDGYDRNDAHAVGRGMCYGGIITNTYCLATFDTPYFSQNTSTLGEWVQRANNKSIVSFTTFECGDPVSGPYTDSYHRHTCNATGGGGCNEPASSTYGCATGFVSVGGNCVRSSAFMTQCFRFGDYDPDSCACTGGCQDGGCSPIVIDLGGNGFDLTDASDGVFFDLDTNGVAEPRGWTSLSSDDAWLALDRNDNGLIDSGRELFGNVTPQEPPEPGSEMNGYAALALYDGPGYGGNFDGKINSQDAVFERLMLWRDLNKNGVSESSELANLPSLGVEEVELTYRRSRRVDDHGNEFRYRAKVGYAGGPSQGRWSWDVFLVTQSSTK